MGLIEGDGFIFYMFSRFKFGWTPSDHGIFSCFRSLLHLIGTIGSVWIMSKKLQLHDSFIGITGLILNLISNIFNIFANESWQLFIISLIDIMYGAALSVQRSIVTKLLPQDEIGKLVSINAAMDCITPMMIAPLFATVYQSTRSYFPEAFFLVEISFAIVAIAIFGVLYHLSRLDEKIEIKERCINSCIQTVS